MIFDLMFTTQAYNSFTKNLIATIIRIRDKVIIVFVNHNWHILVFKIH